jgi:hypothetical protein
MKSASNSALELRSIWVIKSCRSAISSGSSRCRRCGRHEIINAFPKKLWFLPSHPLSISAFQHLCTPGSQSRRCPEAHRRGQPLQSEACNAKNPPESAICGVLRKWSTTTGSVPWLVPISSPRSAPRRVGLTNLRSDALRLWRSPPPCGSPPPHPSRKRPRCSE